MSEPIVLDAIPFNLDAAKLAAGIHLPGEDAELRQAWETLVRNVTRIARPKAIYRDCTVDAVTGDTVVVEGVPLESRVLAGQIGERRRLFAYCATCGTETAELEQNLEPLERFWLEELRLSLLRQAIAYLHREIRRRYRLELLFLIGIQNPQYEFVHRVFQIEYFVFFSMFDMTPYSDSS